MIGSTRMVSGSGCGTDRAAHGRTTLHQGRATPWLIGIGAAAVALMRVLVVGDPTRTVWAEDGLFLEGARVTGAAFLLDPYNGYLHVPHKTVVLLGSLLPIEVYPSFTAAAGTILLVPLVAFVFLCARRLVPSTWAMLPALALVLAPALSNESLATPAAMQFYLLPACLWALLRPWGGGLGRAAQAVALLTGLSSVIAVLLLPVGLLRRSWPATCWLLGGLALQAVAASTTSRPARGDGWSQDEVEIVLSLLGGLGRFPTVATHWGLFVAVVIATVLLAGRRSRDAMLVTATAAAFVVVAVWVNGGVAGRYVAVASCLAASALAFAAPRAPRPVRRLLLATLAVSVVLGFPASDFRLSGPTWECADGVARGAPDGFSEVTCG